MESEGGRGLAHIGSHSPVCHSESHLLAVGGPALVFQAGADVIPFCGLEPPLWEHLGGRI